MNFPDAFELASDFIQYTKCSVFLTGKAGTGKTTFLKHSKENGLKNTVVVAPTGVAAMNAGGTTIHSFFQLPFAPFIPGSKGLGSVDSPLNDQHNLLGRLRLTNDRREVMQQLELLIIDEISMVRCDVLDAIDTILRQVRRQYSKPFGGVQVLLIGDMYQLPPVVKDEEWKILSSYYKSRFFFSSQVLKASPPVYIELDKIYRQTEASFVSLLNQVRNNELDQSGLDLLQSRYQPGFNPSKTDNYITLTTHNARADAINYKALGELAGTQYNFDALVQGEFYEKLYPADLQLKLKPGVQVMFIRNDAEKPRRFFNGRIGTVIKIEEEKIQVMCKGDSIPIEVKKEKWKNTRYAVDKSTNQVQENEIGSFTQFPLRLAWAITIHKSQGLTFEKAIIDAGEAFAPGQVYVALSRCTCLEGLVLYSPIQNNNLHTDPVIGSFIKSQPSNLSQIELLQREKRRLGQEEIRAVFDLTELLLKAAAVLAFVTDHQSSFNAAAKNFVQNIYDLLSGLEKLSAKFKPSLNLLLEQENLPEKNEALHLRLKAATEHFIPQLDHIKGLVQQSPVETDSRMIGNDYNKLLSLFFKKLHEIIHLMRYFEKEFVIGEFLKHKKNCEYPVLLANAYAGKSTAANTTSPNPVLYQLLRKKRDELCDERSRPVYLIAGNASLEEMALYLPQTFDDLTCITGFGTVKSKEYGEAFLKIIGDYCEVHNLHSNMLSKPTKAKKIEKKGLERIPTKLATFNLVKAGKSIAEIAFERKLSVGTVESHISYFAGLGEIDITSFISKDKQEIIRSALLRFGKASVKTLKENLPENVSYGEIRMMMSLL